ncbi:MAG TPA: UvrD-helicase domain-containing protein [Intrasporangium sp.]|uniref:HelD family protein n=1 Tax=Intrasporangium sp. TaxID=1925024 RepID=UPI002D77ED2C|nr:UvrD-helicase domain-containing protein [Intrasporangium sp.]HET7398747.1 UvrD-helicase domain-containing protein [Intrasporangium sp.]
MTSSNVETRGAAVPDAVAQQIAIEQAHVDRVHAELEKAGRRADIVQAEGLARGQIVKSGEVGFEEAAGLFERDALVFHAAKRRSALDAQFEGLVFGRLDLDHERRAPAGEARPGTEREVRYIGRLGVRDDDYEPLVIDWRAPAASAFYRATPTQPMGVVRRRVLRSRGATVIGVEDDLMVPEAPDDIVVVGDGALMAALTRSRGARMRDIVATIQAHQDEAIRASARGITEITGGPGTGKTVVALHRAAYLLYSDRRRFESGGILVIGPSGAYTAYIERVLPSLGEESVVLRAVGDVVDAVGTERLDPPDVARIKGTTRIRKLLGAAARGRVPGAPTEFRAVVSGHAVRLDARTLDRVRAQVLRQHQRNLALAAARTALGEAAWASLDITGDRDAKAAFLDRWEDHLDVESFLAEWWPQVDPREVLLWLADPDLVRRHAHGSLAGPEADRLAESFRRALELGTWSVSDVALIDDLAARVGPVQDEPREERGFYEIEELDDLSQYGVTEVQPVAASSSEATPRVGADDPRGRLLAGRIGRPEEYAHVLIDEAQDLSPMQWRMIGRRGRHASWTVVGDAAQASWPDPAEAAAARDEAFAGQPRQSFHMATNYRNAREIFDYAAEVVRREVPDADIPEAVRETGVSPWEAPLDEDALGAVSRAVEVLAGQVEGSVAVITPARWAPTLRPLAGTAGGRVEVVDPMSTKGLEYDATVVVDPREIAAESPGGVRVLYVALTRAAHRMAVLVDRPLGGCRVGSEV